MTMKCVQCGAETVGENEYCASCQTPVRVLTPEEREEFGGITIAEAEEPGNESEQQWGSGPRVYVHQIQGGLLAKLIVGVIILTILVFALPLALFVIFVSLVTWFFGRLLNRR